MPLPNEFVSRLLDAFDVTIIPDGDNQPRNSDGPGSTLVLGPGDKTSVKNDPVVTLDDDDANFLVYGKAQADGIAPAVDISGDNGLLAVFPGGAVKGEQDGVDASGDNALILNAGSISGGVNGVRLTGNSAVLANFGKVTSDSRAVDILGSGATVLNYGAILGTGDQRNGTIYADNEAEDITVINYENGLIDAGRGNNGAGVSFELGDEAGEAVEATIENYGRIVGRGEAPEGLNTNGDGIRLFSGVEGGGTSFKGDLKNDGQIISNSARGIEVSDGLSFHGKVVNTGRIFGETDGLYFGNAVHSAHVVNEGRIQSDSRAVNIDGSGVELENYGRINGTDDQRNGTVYADGTADNYKIVNHKSGLIDAGRGNDGSAVSLQTGDEDGDAVTAHVKNYGLIRGRGDSTEGNDIGDGVRIFSGVENAIFVGDVINHGRIFATNDSDAAVGIRIEDGVSLSGKIVNHGRIVANEIAIDASDAGGDVNVLNKGLIVGNVVLSDGDDTFDGSSGRVNGLVDGGAGDDTLIGGRRSDKLKGGEGNDEFTGNGGSDVFVFSEISEAISEDVVTDFQNNRDRFDVSDFGFSGLEDIGVVQQGNDVLLTLDLGNTVLVQNTTMDQITEDDFIF
ncbi:MAG: hypothetical protein AAFU82_05005 [Pseudomonadota bacterium]